MPQQHEEASSKYVYETHDNDNMRAGMTKDAAAACGRWCEPARREAYTHTHTHTHTHRERERERERERNREEVPEKDKQTLSQVYSCTHARTHTHAHCQNFGIVLLAGTPGFVQRRTAAVDGHQLPLRAGACSRRSLGRRGGHRRSIFVALLRSDVSTACSGTIPAAAGGGVASGCVIAWASGCTHHTSNQAKKKTKK